MPVRIKLAISAEAEQDIRETSQWIAEQDSVAASQFVSAIVAAIEGIPALAGQHPLAPESKLGFTDEPVHQLLFGKRTKYRILFTHAAGSVTIVRVLHGARKYLGQQLPEDDLDEDGLLQ